MATRQSFFLLYPLLYVCSLIVGSPVALADPPRLVVSIQPLYLLAVEVAGDGVDVQRLIPPQMSPHDYRPLPSQRVQLSRADAIIWMGPELETGFAGILRHESGLPVYSLAALDGHLARTRVGIVSHAGHDHGADAHDWLDPRAAAAMARRLAEILEGLDPAGGEVYRQRAEHLAAALLGLEQNLLPLLAPMHQRRYWVTHDAYGHFEARYGFRHSAIVAISPERQPGAAHILALQRQLEKDQVDCIFREPQLRPPVLERLLADRKVTVIELDPLASAYDAGPGMFVAFLEDFAKRFSSCAMAESDG